MLTELETRLAQVVGSRVPAPFTGRVVRRGAAAPGGNGPVIRVGVESASPVDPELQTSRPEVVPGSTDQRRVVRLRTTVGFSVAATNQGGDAQRLQAADALLYVLDDPDMRSAAALEAPGDPGFLLQAMALLVATPVPAEVDDAAVTVEAEGWFWPVGVEGQAGEPILRALVREFRMPVLLDVSAPLEAGGPAVDVRLSLGTTGTLAVTAGGTASSPFGAVAVRLTDAAGGPGAGELGGGQDGPDGHRVLTVADGGATLSYTPAASPATDTLVVAAYARDADGDERVGVELARFDLVVPR